MFIYSFEVMQMKRLEYIIILNVVLELLFLYMLDPGEDTPHVLATYVRRKK